VFDLLLAYYEPLLREQYDDWPNRLDDLNSLRQIAAGYKELQGLLSDLSIEPPERSDGRSEPVLDDEKPLTLSTIHSAKGLEWQAVFLLGVRDGVLPSSKGRQDEEDVEEERRLLYVAATRAKSQLTLTMSHHGNNGGLERFHRLSRFIESPTVMRLFTPRIAANHPPLSDSAAAATAGNPVPVLGRDALLQRLRQLQIRPTPHP
jgi:DNA helicase II / ATP-dependent DNA helicase PcrA